MWHDDTVGISPELYREVQARYFEWFSQNPAVVAYGTFGSVGAPGLSDLDLIVVVEDESLSSGRFALPSDGGLTAYIVLHAPIVVPRSLISLLPYYHLVDIEWATAPPYSATLDREEMATIASLHVLWKTLYLQSFLWRLMFSKRRPCRRSIIALTSVARSLEWLGRISVSVSETDQGYVKDVIDLRRTWFSTRDDFHMIGEKLDILMRHALEITIALPQTISSILVGDCCADVEAGSDRGLFVAPTQFYYEAATPTPARLVEWVERLRKSSVAGRLSGRYERYIAGNMAFIGAATFAVLDFDFITRQDHHRKTGGRIWGSQISSRVRREVDARLGDSLRRMFDANLRFAVAMNQARLRDSNFGNVWIERGIRGAALRGWAHVLSRLSPWRRLLCCSKYIE